MLESVDKQSLESVDKQSLESVDKQLLESVDKLPQSADRSPLERDGVVQESSLSEASLSAEANLPASALPYSRSSGPYSRSSGPYSRSSGPYSGSSLTNSGSSLIKRARERHYLEKIARGEQPPIVVLSGQSSAGKTTAAQALTALGIEYTTRLMPRPRREGDGARDLAWSTDSGNESGRLRPVDPHAPEWILFAEHKYQGYYGFPMHDLVQILKSGRGASVILGRAEENAPFKEACHNLFPLTPVVLVRLDVPLEILQERLHLRSAAFPGEKDERIAALEVMHRADREQLALVREVYGQRLILNISPAEVQKLGFHPDQIRGVDLASGDLRKIIGDYVAEAKSESRVLAQDLLQERVIHYGHRFVPDGLTDVLENRLLPHAEQKGFAVYLKAGLAATVYLEESRPVSLDIDFTLRGAEKRPEMVKELLEAISGEPRELTTHWEKATYHVLGAGCKVTSERTGEFVELDGISRNRVQPNNRGFVFEFSLDAHDLFHSRIAKLPSGREVFLTPPENILLDKLTAGRGSELGKFDLFDAAGLLAKIPLNITLMRKMIQKERFDHELDREIVAELTALDTDGVGIRIDRALEQIGIINEWVREEARAISDRFFPGEAASSPSSQRTLTLDELKQFSLVDRIDCSLQAILGQLNTPVIIGGEETSIAARFGAERVKSGVEKLRQFLEYTLSFELGRRDIYVRRPGGAQDERERFFSKLDEQRERLS